MNVVKRISGCGNTPLTLLGVVRDALDMWIAEAELKLGQFIRVRFYRYLPEPMH